MRGVKRTGAGRKRKPEYLKRELLTIRLPKWMIEQIKSKGEIGYVIEYQLGQNDFPGFARRLRYRQLEFYAKKSVTNDRYAVQDKNC